MTAAADQSFVPLNIRTCRRCLGAFPAPTRPGRPPIYCPPCRAAVETDSHATIIRGGTTARAYRRAIKSAVNALRNGRPAPALIVLERILK